MEREQIAIRYRGVSNEAYGECGRGRVNCGGTGREGLGGRENKSTPRASGLRDRYAGSIMLGSSIFHDDVRYAIRHSRVDVLPRVCAAFNSLSPRNPGGAGGRVSLLKDARGSGTVAEICAKTGFSCAKGPATRHHRYDT